MNELPEDVLLFLCAIAGDDESGVALELIAKYAPDIIAGLFSGQQSQTLR